MKKTDSNEWIAYSNWNEKIDELVINNLSDLQNEVVNSSLSKVIPQKYLKEIKSKNSEEKKAYIFLFKSWRELLSEETFNTLTTNLPLDEITSFLYELTLIDKEKDLTETATIILTQKEIADLKKIFATWTTKTQLNKLKIFIEQQLNENVTTAELIGWTELFNKIENSWKNPYEIANRVDEIWYAFLQQNFPNISRDALRNMATWMSLWMLELYNSSGWKITLNNFLTMDWIKKIIIKNKAKSYLFFKRVTTFISAIKDIPIKHPEDAEKYKYLMDSVLFGKLFYYSTISYFSKEHIVDLIMRDRNISSSEVYPDKDLLKKKVKSILDNAWQKINTNDVNAINNFSDLWQYFKWVKNKLKFVREKLYNDVIWNADTIFDVKDLLENIWAWEYAKEIFDKILKMFWFKNWWDDFEKNATSKYKFINLWLKWKTSLSSLKNKENEKLIFYNVFKDKKLDKIVYKWWLSYNVMKILWWENYNDKNYINNKLNYFFSRENFSTIIKKLNISEKDFYENAFTIKKEEIKTTNKNNTNEAEKKENIIWIIDFDYINKIIKKAYENKIITNNDIVLNKNNVKKDIENNKKENEKYNYKTYSKEVENIAQKLFNVNFSYDVYIKSIAKEESTFNYKAVNKKTWALWKYQFMLSTLENYKNIICWDENCNKNKIKKKFLNNPEIQELVMLKYTINHIKLLKKKKIEVKTSEELAKLLAKCHISWCGNIDKNYSDWNISANDYAEAIWKEYNDLSSVVL